MTDDLERRLRAADPSPPARAVDSARSPRAQTLVERVMSEVPSQTDSAPGNGASGSRRPILLAAAAVVVVVLGGIGIAVAVSDDDAAPTSVEFTAGAAGGPSMVSCIEFSPEHLVPVDAAIDGTVSSVTDEAVTLDVTTWYKGGDADQVVLGVPEGGAQVSIDGVEFTSGSRYLVTATDGTVNTCGLSGPYTAEYEAAFQEAFPG